MVRATLSILVSIFPLLLAGPALGETAATSSFTYELVKFKGRHTRIRVGYHEKRETDIGTVLYMNGYTDQMGNHIELFEDLRRSNLRVISFDYPGHGESHGVIGGWKLEEIAELASRTMEHAKIDTEKPLILSGFSTGATIAIRMLQEWKHLIPFGVRIGGAILVAPGVPVKATAGTFGLVTERRLTRGRLNHRPRPVTTTFGGIFVTDLLFESNRTKRELFPENIPVVVYLADEKKDHFNHVRLAERWVKWNRENRRMMHGFKCENAYHTLEVEPNGVGTLIRRMTLQFALSMTEKKKRSFLKTAKYFSTNNYVCPPIK